MASLKTLQEESEVQMKVGSRRRRRPANRRNVSWVQELLSIRTPRRPGKQEPRPRACPLRRS